MVKSTMYSIEELTVLKEKIVQNLDEVIFALNRKNNLDDLLVFLSWDRQLYKSVMKEIKRKYWC